VTSAAKRAEPLRLEVQALRALAAMAVVVYHFWPGRVSGGYVGVDIFFVISGFLITSHLAREIEASGGVRLLRFWSRRARRLLPASYLVIVVSLVGVFALLPRISWRQNLAELIASSVYGENWRLAHDAVDYLASANEPSVVQHYWTLSLEEQFYLFWPLLLLLLHHVVRRRGRRGLAALVGVVTAVSLAGSIWLTASNPSWAYFVTPGRVWEFGIGALLALLLTQGGGRRRIERPGGLSASIASWLGLAVLASVMLTYSDATPFPGVAALLPTVATVVVIAAGMPAGRLSPAPLLALRPVQWVGEISYSVYLWHWPLLVLAPAALGHGLGLWPRLVLLALTLVLAWLTTRYVENPIRRHQRVVRASPRLTLLASAAAAVVLVIPAVGGIHVVNASAARAQAAADALVDSHPRCFGAASMDLDRPCHNPDLDTELVPAPANVKTGLIDYPGCFAEYTDTHLLDCTFGDQTSDLPHVLLLGDSHAQMFLPTLVGLAADHRLTVSAQLKAACPWASPDYPAAVYKQECGAWRTSLETWLAQHARDYDLVITTGRMDDVPGTSRQQRRGLAEAWRVVGEQGVPVAAILDNPMWPEDPNACLAEIDADEVTPTACGLPRSRMRRFQDPQPGAARTVDNAHIVDLGDLYCHDEWCPAIAGGVDMYRDYSHLSVPYAASVGPYLYRRLIDQGLLPAVG
jgi:peptidoglycan/LPS O-acetylase OafA/YrhL